MSIRERAVLRHYKNAVELVDDTLADEQSLTIRVLGKRPGETAFLARTMCTPGEDERLVIGHLFTEGCIQRPEEIAGLHIAPAGPSQVLAEVRLHNDSIHIEAAPPFQASAEPDEGLSAEDVSERMAAMEAGQVVFKRTGGTHSAALYSQDGERLAMAEDIGRHNALDKIIGTALLEQTLPRAYMATMSSRLSSELVHKAVAAKLRVLCGISVATVLAVDMAEAHGLTLVGRVRGGRMNVYTRKDRIHWPRGNGDQGLPKCGSAS